MYQFASIWPGVYGFMALFYLMGTNTCIQRAPDPVLSGHIVMDEQWKPMVYLIKPAKLNEIAATYAGSVLDSASISTDGSFSFNRPLPLSEPSLVEICIQQKESRFQNALIDEDIRLANYFPLVLEPGKRVELHAVASHFQQSMSIKSPSVEHAYLLKLRDIRHMAFNKTPDLLLPDTAHDELKLIPRAEALEHFQAPLMAFADTCQQFLPAMVAIRWISPASDYERVPEFMLRQCEMWKQKRPAHAWVNELCKVANPEKLPVRISQQIPNFPLPMLQGDTVLLHTLLGKRLTILDIWASWCAPCRKENREFLVPIWQTYQERGLQVIGYSIDGSAGPWKAAVIKDQAVWPQASHLTGDSTPFMEALRISTIPANYLLNEKGEVIAKNLHGQALTDFVQAYMK